MDERAYEQELLTLLEETKDPTMRDAIQEKVAFVQSYNYRITRNAVMDTVLSKVFAIDIDCIKFDIIYPLSVIREIIAREPEVVKSLYKSGLPPKLLLDSKDPTVSSVAMLEMMKAHAVDMLNDHLDHFNIRQYAIACSGIFAGGTITESLLGNIGRNIGIVYFDNVWKYMLFCALAGKIRKAKYRATDIQNIKLSLILKGKKKHTRINAVLCENINTAIQESPFSFMKVQYDGINLLCNFCSIQDIMDRTGTMNEKYIDAFKSGAQDVMDEFLNALQNGFTIKMPTFSTQNLVIDGSGHISTTPGFFRDIIIASMIPISKAGPIQVLIAQDPEMMYKFDGKMIGAEVISAQHGSSLDCLTKIQAFMTFSKFSNLQKLLFYAPARWWQLEDLYFMFPECKTTTAEEVKLDADDWMRLSKTIIIDFISLENKTMLEFLQHNENFIVEIDDRYYGSSLESVREILNKRDFTVECRQQMAGVPRAEDIDVDRVFVLPYFDPMTYIDASCLCLIAKAVKEGKCRVFSLGDRKQVEYTTSLLNAAFLRNRNYLGDEINIVSARHCNEGSQIDYFSSVKFITIANVASNCTLI